VNSSVELHDSVLESLEVSGGVARVALRPAYLHRSLGRPGIDAGSGWVADVDLRLSDASLSAKLPSLPANVRDGSLEIAGKRFENQILMPVPAGSPVVLTLTLDSADFTVRGSSLVLELRSEPRYVEEFSGHDGGGVA
jgi:hypothetical protein